jgi:predicted alpha-1,2-mannosidase
MKSNGDVHQDLAGYVDPLIGTKDGDTDFGHGGGAGMVFPGAVVPFGMMQWSPDTVRRAGGGYKYEDTRLRGFSMTHISGPGCTGAQDFPVIPLSGTIGNSPATHADEYIQTFSHRNEDASPGYYGLTLDSGIRVELTASRRAGIGRFHFPAGRPGTLLLDVSGSINGVTDAEARIRGNTVSGYAKTGGFCGSRTHYHVYFHATFDQPFQAYGTWKNDWVRPGPSGRSSDVAVKGPGCGVYLQFGPSEGEPVQMRAGISYVSIEGAQRNLDAEVGVAGFDQVQAAARRVWNERLGQVSVAGGTEDQRRTFYTSLYHALLQPYVFEDVDGAYTGFDYRTHQVKPGHHHYATFSGWDIYRSEVQLLALLLPDVASDIAQSMYDDAHSIGDVWDRWSHQNAITGVMVGDPYHSILASMYAFGARDFAAHDALVSMVKGANRVGPDPATGYDERPGNADYLRLGYVPGEVATTLEYNVADFGVAQLAQRLGDTATHLEFMRRAQGWQALFNPATDWLQPRFADGSFLTPFDPADASWYVEGNGAQYHWMVPHNVRALFNTMGGPDAVIPRLDTFFTELNAGSNQPYAYLGNEPSLQSPWLYPWAGVPYRTQDVVRRAQEWLFKPTPDGLVGNDDLGTMSSWYVWASFGMYPVIPGRAELVLGIPIFEQITIRRSSGQVIAINAPGASTANRYVRSLAVDGVASHRAWLAESFVASGGRLDYVLDAVPNAAFGSDAADAPPSFDAGQQPFLSTVDPGLLPVQPGSALTATLVVQAIGAGDTLTWSAHAPAGMTLSTGSGELAVAAGGRRSQQVTVEVADRVATGVYSVPFEVRSSAGPVVGRPAIELRVAARGTLRWYANNAGISDDAQPTAANFDGSGWSYSAQALAAAGLRRGGLVRWNGFTFTWPDQAAGEMDNVALRGQVIEVPSAPVGATRLALLGSATNGDGQSTVIITYTDGSTATAVFGLSDWALARDSYPPRFGNEIVAKSAYRNWSTGEPYETNVYVFATKPIQLDVHKQLESMTVPAPARGGVLHVFAWSLA